MQGLPTSDPSLEQLITWVDRAVQALEDAGVKKALLEHRLKLTRARRKVWNGRRLNQDLWKKLVAALIEIAQSVDVSPLRRRRDAVAKQLVTVRRDLANIQLLRSA